MKASDCFSPGFIVKPHGLKGGVTAKLTVKQPQAYGGLDALFLEQRGQLVPFLVESISIKENLAYIKLEGIDTQEQAMELRSAKLYLPADMAPKIDVDDPSMTIGYAVHDEHFGNLGPVLEIMTVGPQDTLVIGHEKTDVLIPFVPQMIVGIDHKTRTVKTNCPEGLIDMYLGE